MQSGKSKVRDRCSASTESTGLTLDSFRGWWWGVIRMTYTDTVVRGYESSPPTSLTVCNLYRRNG